MRMPRIDRQSGTSSSERSSADRSKTDPAHEDPGNRKIIPQIQDETWGVFYTLRYKQSKIKIYIKEFYSDEMKYLFEGEQCSFYRIGLFQL